MSLFHSHFLGQSTRDMIHQWIQLHLGHTVETSLLSFDDLIVNETPTNQIQPAYYLQIPSVSLSLSL
jgi:hypothetical protein